MVSLMRPRLLREEKVAMSKSSDKSSYNEYGSYSSKQTTKVKSIRELIEKHGGDLEVPVSGNADLIDVLTGKRFTNE